MSQCHPFCLLQCLCTTPIFSATCLQGQSLSSPSNTTYLWKALRLFSSGIACWGWRHGTFFPATAGQTSLFSCASCNGLPAAGQEWPGCCLPARLGGLCPRARRAAASGSSQRCYFAGSMLIRSLWWDAALRAGKCGELLGNSTCKLIQTLLLVWHANSEALHHWKGFLTHFFSVKCCKEAGLYNRVGVTAFITSWRATGLGMLTEWKNTCRSPVWSYACMGDSFSATSLAAGHGCWP